MNPGRREFLKKGLLLTAGTAAGLTLAGAEKPLPGTVPTAPPPSPPAGCGTAPIPALTPDGRLIQVAPGNAVAAGSSSRVPIREGVAGKKWVMVIDLAKCDGCKKCAEACSKMHLVPPEREWLKVLKMQDSPDTAPYWFPKPCFQCDNPPCTKVCPVDATYKRTDGVVLIDNERCIGCRFCMAACPYSTRCFNWKRPAEPKDAKEQPYSPERGFPRRVGTVEKCDFCPDLASQGKLPACASTCPMGVIYFGDQSEDAVTNSSGETLRLSSLLRDRAGYRFLDDLGTEPRVFYLPPKNRLYPAPGETRGHRKEPPR